MKKTALWTALLIGTSLSTNAMATNYMYDEDGRLIQESYGSGYVDYTYNSEGYLVLKKESNGNTTSYTYDAKGNKLTEVYEHGDVVSDYTYTYDDKGNVIKEVWKTNEEFESPSSITSITQTYSYDDKGNRLSYTYEDDIGNTSTSTTTYDDHNNPITRSYTDGGVATQNLTYEYVYDDRGNILTLTTIVDRFDGNIYESEVSYTYTYDENGNILNKETHKGNGEVVYSTYTYDETGNLLSVNEHGVYPNHNNDWRSYKAYNYDEYGNLINEKDSFGSVIHSYSYKDPNWKVNKAHRDWLAKRKLIYTIEEAAAVSKETGNTFKLRYK